MIPLGDMLDHLSQAYSFKEIRLRGVAITDMVKFMKETFKVRVFMFAWSASVNY